MAFPDKDKQILRALAEQVAAAAALPEQAATADRWRRHNRLERGRPPILVFPEGSWREPMPDSALACTDPFCRAYEHQRQPPRPSIGMVRPQHRNTPSSHPSAL